MVLGGQKSPASAGHFETKEPPEMCLPALALNEGCQQQGTLGPVPCIFSLLSHICLKVTQLVPGRSQIKFIALESCGAGHGLCITKPRVIGRQSEGPCALSNIYLYWPFGVLRPLQ